MTLHKTTQARISMGQAHKTDLRAQFSALPYRIVKDRVQVLLITSRGTGRWLAPKGWPIDGVTPAETAAREAWEEAGVIGKAQDFCLGIYSYKKEIGGSSDLAVAVALFPLKVKQLAKTWPEAKERKRKWFSLKKAAAAVGEPELRQIIANFDPRLLRR